MVLIALEMRSDSDSRTSIRSPSLELLLMGGRRRLELETEDTGAVDIFFKVRIRLDTAFALGYRLEKAPRRKCLNPQAQHAQFLHLRYTECNPGTRRCGVGRCFLQVVAAFETLGVYYGQDFGEFNALEFDFADVHDLDAQVANAFYGV